MSAEMVLVVPTPVFHELGLFQGLCTDVGRYLPRLLATDHLRFIPRPEAENDPTFKQLIPYVVLRWQNSVFHYRRGQGAGEKRLRALRSIGVGGHINPIDDRPGEVSYRQALMREIAEEIYLETTYRERCVGLINDDSTPVGQVHLGIVHLFDLDEPKARRRETDIIHDGFAPIGDLQSARNEFETWSQFALEYLSDAASVEA